MGKTYFVFIIILFSTLAASAEDTLKVLSPKPQHFEQTRWIHNLLRAHHYAKKEMNDSISSVIFDNLLEAIDYNKLYFLEKDIETFREFEDQMDDHISSAKLGFPFEVFKSYRLKALARMEKVFDRLDQGFDFTLDEEHNFSKQREEWAKTEKELDERWRQVLKTQALSLKLAQKDSAGITSSLIKRYEQFRRNLVQYNSEDVYQLFMNAYLSVFDPHTNYFSPISSENFKINMSLSLEGIGARLSQQIEYTVINEVIPGGPAFKSKQLNKDDKIIGVGQGDDGDFEDIIGWRLDDVVQKIRGPKGTVVKLLILRKGDSPSSIPDTVRIVRDKIKLDDQAAKSEIFTLKNGDDDFKLGVISIRSFYLSFEDRRRGDPNYRSTTRDVKKLIVDLKSKGVDGLMVDLRYNGGGALEEAINMSGLFIPGGPVVQVKNTMGLIDVKRDVDFNVYYDGPLFVMVNRHSASASEIFAGAIQDYQRGIVIGENTFGKGTVQELLGLRSYIRTYDPRTLGQLKLTRAKFYRVTGSSTQRRGVVPDIQFPMPFDPDEIGESSRKNALPWDKIQPSQFNRSGEVTNKDIRKINDIFVSDLQSDEYLKQWRENIIEAKEDQDDEVSLNYQDRLKVLEEMNRKKEQKTEDKGIIELFEFEEDEQKKKIEGDLFLREGLKLLMDFVKLS